MGRKGYQTDRENDSMVADVAKPDKDNPAFYCRTRRRRVEFCKCLDDYVDANAFERRRAACWRCPQGRRNRQEYADS